MFSEYIQKSKCPVKDNQILFSYNDDPFRNEGKHYVLWSGGCDSTLVLYELLDAFGSENVVAVSYRYPWLDPNKYENERLHREAFKHKMKLKGEKFANFKHTEFTISHMNVPNEPLSTDFTVDLPIQGYGLPQAIAWLLSLPIYADNNSYIYDGGIKSDELNLHLESYHKLFTSISELLDRRFILREPLLYHNKFQVIEKLIQYEIYDETWFCESPTGNEPCCKCPSCVDHITALTCISKYFSTSFTKMKAMTEIEKIDKIVEKHNHAEEIIPG